MNHLPGWLSMQHPFAPQPVGLRAPSLLDEGAESSPAAYQSTFLARPGSSSSLPSFPCYSWHVVIAAGEVSSPHLGPAQRGQRWPFTHSPAPEFPQLVRYAF